VRAPGRVSARHAHTRRPRARAAEEGGGRPVASRARAERGIGDVLLAWENEAFLAVRELGPDKFGIVVPSLSILAEPPVAVVEGNAKAKGEAECNAKGKAKAQPTAKANAKVNANFNDNDISTKWDKVHTPCYTLPKAASIAARGLEGVTLEGMTKNGYQVVMDRLTHIKKDTGDGNALDNYKGLRGQDKLEFALKLKVDGGAALHDCRRTSWQGCNPVCLKSGRMGDRSTGCT
jgi:hypothetical protein